MQKFDYIISGGGPNGLFLALLLTQKLNAPSIAILEQASASTLESSKDSRLFSIKYSNIQVLSELGVEFDLQEATDILTILIKESNLYETSRLSSLNQLTLHAYEADLPFLGKLINAKLLKDKLLTKVQQYSNIQILFETQLDSLDSNTNSVEITLSNGNRLKGSWLLSCEGVHSPLRKRLGIQSIHYNYHQTAIVGYFHHTEPHHHLAIEHFLALGPLATLPSNTPHYSAFVQTLSNQYYSEFFSAEGVINTQFLQQHIQQLMRHQLGVVTEFEHLQSYPLILNLAKQFTHNRVVLVGDSAHRIHPVAGLGLNLGLDDSRALVHLFTQSNDSNYITKQYNLTQKKASYTLGASLDLLTVFYHQHQLLPRLIRCVGLNAIEFAPLIKRAIVEQASY